MYVQINALKVKAGRADPKSESTKVRNYKQIKAAVSIKLRQRSRFT